MRLSTIITFFVFIVLVFIGTTLFLFWRFGIFRAEYQPSPLLTQIQSQLDFIKKYDFRENFKNVENLNIEKISLPQFSQEELGRPSLFSNPR